MTERSTGDGRGMAGKRIAMVGTGATAAGFGADLVRAGLDVTFIDQWPAHVEAMRANGLRVELPDETVTTPVSAFHMCEVATLRAPFDIVLLGVKGYDTRWACELIEAAGRPRRAGCRSPERHDDGRRGLDRGARAHAWRGDRGRGQHVRTRRGRAADAAGRNLVRRRRV